MLFYAYIFFFFTSSQKKTLTIIFNYCIVELLFGYPDYIHLVYIVSCDNKYCLYSFTNNSLISTFIKSDIFHVM